MSYPSPDLTIKYGAGVILKHTNSLQHEIEGVKAGKDIECIHRMRVASRRLRNALPLFTKYLPSKKAKTWIRECRNITRSLGAARDADVQIAYLQAFLNDLTDPHLKTGIRRLILRLKQKRVILQGTVIHVLEDLTNKEILTDIQNHLISVQDNKTEFPPYPSDLYYLAYQSIEKCLVDFLQKEECIYHPEMIEDLHMMRIFAKHLRYTEEAFAPLYSGQLQAFIDPTRKSQELLGKIHDCDVWTANLPVFLEEEKKRVLEYCGSIRPWLSFLPGIEYFQNKILQQRQEIYQGFLREWQKWKNKDVWNNLRRTIQHPLQKGDIFPPLQTSVVETTSQE